MKFKSKDKHNHNMTSKESQPRKLGQLNGSQEMASATKHNVYTHTYKCRKLYICISYLWVCSFKLTLLSN